MANLLHKALSASLWACLCAQAIAQGTPPSQRLTELVDPYAVPLPVGPTKSGAASTADVVVDVVSNAVQYLNKAAVYSSYKQQFNAELTDGLAKAKASGQNGVLIESSIVTQETEAGAFLSLRGNGAALIGVGPSAESICVLAKCGAGLYPQLSPGQSLDDGIGYTFVAIQPDGRYKFSNYDRKSLIDRTEFVLASSELQSSVLFTAHNQAFDGYVRALQAKPQTAVSRAAIEALISNRVQTASKIRDIEFALAVKIEEARRANLAADSLQMLANVFSLAGAIANVATTLGTEPKNRVGGAIVTRDELDLAVEDAKDQSAMQVLQLQSDLADQRAKFQETEDQLINEAPALGLKPEDSPAIKIRIRRD